MRSSWMWFSSPLPDTDLVFPFNFELTMRESCHHQSSMGFFCSKLFSIGLIQSFHPLYDVWGRRTVFADAVYLPSLFFLFYPRLLDFLRFFPTFRIHCPFLLGKLTQFQPSFDSRNFLEFPPLLFHGLVFMVWSIAY